MALIWYRQEGDRRYEVRTAGHSCRLYTNGVFHSQFNPHNPVSGNVWDLLMLPAFFAPERLRRVLVLGVGGGAVIRQLNHFLSPERIVGVELNPVHLEVAERFFGVAAENVELVEADARLWLRQYRGERFDLIIDDLFGDADGDPQRAVAADSRWMKQLLKRLSTDGTLVINFGSPPELKQCAWFGDQAVNAKFPTAFRLTTPLYENVVGAFLRRTSDGRVLRQNLAAWSELDMKKKSCRLNYQMRRL
ncbi:MAG: spermidine synthase [Pseudomonadota bacterium]